MKGYWIMRTVTWVGILASLFVSFMAGAALMQYGFGFVFAAMFGVGIGGMCLGGLYLNELDQRWLSDQVRVEGYEPMTPFPVLDRV
jgi:hypothetical protein